MMYTEWATRRIHVFLHVERIVYILHVCLYVYKRRSLSSTIIINKT